MTFLADVASLGDDSLPPFEKWEAIRRLERVDQDTLVQSNFMDALNKIFESDQALLRHAALQLANSKAARTTESQKTCRALMKVVEAPRDRMDSHSRILALQALGASTTTDDFLCIESVAAAAKHDETDVRKAAVKCLGSLKAESGGKSHPRIARKLLPLLQDFDSGVREQVVRALGRVSTFGDESSVIALAMSASRDVSTSVRKAAEDILVQMWDEQTTVAFSESSDNLSRVKTSLREINCKLEPGIASLIGL